MQREYAIAGKRTDELINGFAGGFAGRKGSWKTHENCA